MANLNRRLFIGSMGALTFSSGIGVLGGLNSFKAHAADTSGYKALVCLFFKGGMDHADTIIPFDQSSYNQLRSVRGELLGRHGENRNLANLLKLNPANAAMLGGREFALPPAMAPFHALFEAGEAAVIGGVGPLIEPTNRAAIEAGTAVLPSRLASHNDQQSTWMSLASEGSQFGWGGLFADAVLASSTNENPIFAAISAAGNDVFLAGRTARQFRVTSGGSDALRILENQGILGREPGDNEARAILQRYYARQQSSSTNLYNRDIQAATGRATANTERFADARDNAVPLSTSFPQSGLGSQLQAIAETINIQQFLGNQRQVFYASIGGFDTHNGQAGSLPALHGQIADAMVAFRQAMVEIGRWNDVTMFTASDFGRTLTDNGDGTDHGWGGHQLVAGGSVRGGRIYGELASSDIAASTYTPSRGRLIPAVSVEQYASTLGRWFGLDTNELRTALPNLGNFNAQDLGFMAGSTST